MRKYLMLIAAIAFIGFSGFGKQYAKHVVYIGMDGWGAYSVEKADIPNIKGLMAQGAYTLKKRSVLPSSSACNWASMFMGASPEIHGYTLWNSKVPEIPSRTLGKDGIFPTVFELIREKNPNAEMGCIFEWSGIKYVVDSLAFNYIQQTPKIEGEDRCSLTTDLAVKYITEKKPVVCTVVFDEPDHTGHKDGHDTPAYYERLKSLDVYVGKIIEAVKKAGMFNETIFIISADHGGINKGHGGKTLQEMQTPFIICGKNIKNIGAFDESMMQFDCASTLAYIFGIQQPQVWIGRPMKQVFK